jgi:3-hydroxyacyl-CoA dehydrogenase
MKLPDTIRTPSCVAILGGGTIGASWAALLTAHRYEVRILEPNLAAHDRCRQLVRRQLQQLCPGGVSAASKVSITDDLPGVVSKVPWILECAPERLDLKRLLIAEVEQHASPEALVASSSSALQPSQLQEGMRHPHRLAVAHPFNPPHLIPLVELVAGPSTAAATMDSVEQLMRSIGKVTIRVRKELVGHVANRLTAALWREAVHLVAIGAASVADIDLAMTCGPGLRWAAVGPHMGYHLAGGPGGIRHYLEHLGPTQQERWSELGAPQLDERTCTLLVAGVHEEADGRTLDELEQQRDRRLRALLETLRSEGANEGGAGSSND